MTQPAPRTRIQMRNRKAILAAALDQFAAHGFRGATLDGIAGQAGLSKPNLLYYFPSKEAIHLALLDALLEDWLTPLEQIDPAGDPIAELMAYVQRKLSMSQTHARESRLFANEVLRGAPHIEAVLGGRLRALVDDKAQVIAGWMEDGRLARLDPYHLLFSIWALTQHYADFESQVRAVLGEGHDPFAEAAGFTETLYRRLLTP